MLMLLVFYFTGFHGGYLAMTHTRPDAIVSRD